MVLVSIRARKTLALLDQRCKTEWVWLALGLLGMLLVSPAVALATLVIFAGWMFFTNESRSLSWKSILVFLLIFAVGCSSFRLPSTVRGSSMTPPRCA
jgi:hypothetical protein